MENFDFGDDVLETGCVDKESGFAKLSELIRDMAKQEIATAKAKEIFKEQESRLENIQRVLIPNLMESLDCVSHTTGNGLTITVKRKVKASITDKTRDGAVAWFTEHKLDRLLSNDFVLKLTKGQDDKVATVKAALDASGVPYTNKKGVHHSTLSAWVRERDAAGENVPDELLNVYRFSEAKIS